MVSNGKYDEPDKSSYYKDANVYAYVNNYEYVMPKFTKFIKKSRRYYKNLYKNKDNIDFNMNEAEKRNIQLKFLNEIKKRKEVNQEHRRNFSHDDKYLDIKQVLILYLLFTMIQANTVNDKTKPAPSEYQEQNNENDLTERSNHLKELINNSIKVGNRNSTLAVNNENNYDDIPIK